MPKTDAQRQADTALEAAMAQAVAAYNLIDDSTLVEWVAVVEGLTFDDAGEIDCEHFGIVFRSGNARTSVALGLLAKGKDLLQYGERADDADGTA